ncbi:MAG: hypothetical protein PVH21_18505, partial [Myxococcales bacterium]
MEVSALGSWLRRLLRPQLLLAVLLVAAGAHFLWWVNRFYPIRDWLFWHYLGCWILVSVWSLGLVSTGWAVLNKLGLDQWSIGERLVVGHAVGLFSFFLLMFALGLAGLYGGVFFFALPLLMVAIGARPLWRDLAPRVATWIRTARRPSLLVWVATA